MTFACGEAEAWDILNNRNDWMRKDFTMLGASDGETYFRIMREAARELPEKRAARDKLASDAARYRTTEDRLRFSELKGDDDEQVAKVVGILAELDAKIAAADLELANWNREVVERAFAAELAKAEGVMTRPRNADIITPNEGDRAVIVANLPRR
jgi:hypothetical protein